MSESGMKTFIGHYLLKLKAFFLSKNVLSFLLFLLLSFAFWFINMLDKERETMLTIPLRYTGMPQQYDITKANVQFVNVVVKDKGVNLFTYANAKLSALTINLNRNFSQRGTIVLNNDEIRSKLLKYLLPTTSILEVKPDSLVLVYEQLASKSVPVIFNGKIETVQQYILSESVLIEPAQIVVYGPKRLINRVKSVKTDWTEFLEVDENLVSTVKLQKIESIRFSTDDIKLSVFAEMFTEKELLFPIKVINCPENLIVRTFPAQVKLKFNVGLSHFKNVSVNDVEVFVDYNDLSTANGGKYPVSLKNNASYISNLRSEVDEVEYVIERK